MFGHARRLGPGVIKAAIGRWRRFCEQTPKGLAELKMSRQPWLRVSADYFRFFPRRIGKTLSVSEFDAAVLSPFSSNSWRPPLELFTSERLRGHRFLLNHGDLLPLLRLDAWTTSWPLPVLRRRPTGDERGYRRHEYQLTGHGIRVLREGLGSIGWGPPLAMGGHAAYDTERPWVTRETRGAGSSAACDDDATRCFPLHRHGRLQYIMRPASRFLDGRDVQSSGGNPRGLRCDGSCGSAVPCLVRPPAARGRRTFARGAA